MPIATLNGISVNYQVDGTGDLVVLIMGTGSPGRVWSTHQVPALRRAGFRVATFDNRGIAPTDDRAGFTIDDLVADTAALIEMLGAPAYVAGTSMGARVAQELALSRPELVRKAVFLAGHARMDQFQLALTAGERALYDEKVELPARYQAAITAALNLSPATLADDIAARDWIDIFEFTGGSVTPGVRAQLAMDKEFDRRDAYRAITVPCLAVGFADDRMIPPRLTREVADVIPDCDYFEIADAGHYGYLEQPAAVNKALVGFFGG